MARASPETAEILNGEAACISHDSRLRIPVYTTIFSYIYQSPTLCNGDVIVKSLRGQTLLCGKWVNKIEDRSDMQAGWEAGSKLPSHPFPSIYSYQALPTNIQGPTSLAEMKDLELQM